MNQPELLIPAKNLATLKIAILYGADAVYIGGQQFGLRANAQNFSIEEMREGIAFAHERGKKVYITLNITAHNADLEGIRQYLYQAKQLQPDAWIISDPGVFDLAKEITPEIEVHISTQANNVNYATYRFWHRLGATRVVSARELSLDEIGQIRANIPDALEIETFVHGAMCMSYSGRCLLSNYLTGKDANLGACTHPCRWKYHLMEETRPGEYFPVFEDERGTYIFNSKDLCMIEHIPELVAAGINSFKVEGRMKNALYVATVAKVYREAIDTYFRSAQQYQENIPQYQAELRKGTYRAFTTGFFFGKPSQTAQNYDQNAYIQSYTYLGYIKEVQKDGWCCFTQKNKFSVGDTVEILRPIGEPFSVTIQEMRDMDGTDMQSCPHPKQLLMIRATQQLQPYDIIRKKIVS